MHTPHTAPAQPVRIALAGDHPVFLKGLCSALAECPQFCIAGCACNGQKLIALVEETQPDVIITDLQMPVTDGIAATTEIKKRFPRIQVIVFFAFADDEYITTMLEAGTSGLLLKNEEITNLFHTIEKVMSGQACFSPEAANRVVALVQRTCSNPMKPMEKPSFTSLEILVMKEIICGLSLKQIAQKLKIKIASARGAMQRIRKKTRCHNAAAIAVYAIKNYIVKIS